MNWRKVLQFTLVHVGVAITAVPINSTLNRIMITNSSLSISSRCSSASTARTCCFRRDAEVQLDEVLALAAD